MCTVFRHAFTTIITTITALWKCLVSSSWRNVAFMFLNFINVKTLTTTTIFHKSAYNATFTSIKHVPVTLYIFSRSIRTFPVQTRVNLLQLHPKERGYPNGIKTAPLCPFKMWFRNLLYVKIHRTKNKVFQMYTTLTYKIPSEI